jgi:hypothetical protein
MNSAVATIAVARKITTAEGNGAELGLLPKRMRPRMKRISACGIT